MNRPLRIDSQLSAHGAHAPPGRRDPRNTTRIWWIAVALLYLVVLVAMTFALKPSILAAIERGARAAATPAASPATQGAEPATTVATVADADASDSTDSTVAASDEASRESVAIGETRETSQLATAADGRVKLVRCIVDGAVIEYLNRPCPATAQPLAADRVARGSAVAGVTGVGSTARGQPSMQYPVMQDPMNAAPLQPLVARPLTATSQAGAAAPPGAQGQDPFVKPGTIYRCKQFTSGALFWTIAHCSRFDAHIDRIASVPASKPFHEQVWIASAQAQGVQRSIQAEEEDAKRRAKCSVLLAEWDALRADRGPDEGRHRHRTRSTQVSSEVSENRCL